MRLLAISDLHLRYPVTRRALGELPSFPGDWLLLGGDCGETAADLEYSLSILGDRFEKVFWVPGNHDLWTLPSRPGEPRGEGKYRQLVELCRRFGVVTPEDPFVEWPGAGPRRLIAPLFLLYDYTFRPSEIADDEVLAWAAEADIVCADEALLHPDPHPSRGAWCAARCEATEARLAEAVRDPDVSLVLLNHYPLRQDLVRLPRVPRFSPWCGTRRTTDWHRRFNAEVVVYGHLHVRGTHFRDGVRFEEASLGYPRDWNPRFGIGPYLREILPGPAAAAAKREESAGSVRR